MEASAIISAILGFFLGILAASIVDLIKQTIEIDRLILLFQAEIKRNWRIVNAAGASVPEGELFARMIFTFRGVDQINLQGIPEYDFEVCNVTLFETEGVKLAQHLGTKGRLQFWEVFSLMRDAETVRKVLKDGKSDSQLRGDYQRLFKALLSKLGDELAKLDVQLGKEASTLSRVFG